MTARKAPQKLGRPPLHGVTMRKVLVVLDEASIARARALGAGNVSAGVRRALERV